MNIYEEREAEESINLMDYYYVLLKHKWLIFACFVITVSLTLFFTLRMKPVYRATSTMVIENEQIKSPLTGETIDYGTYVTQALNFNTHLKLMKSQPILERIINTYKLDQLDMNEGEEKLQISFIKDFVAQLKKNLKLLAGRESEEPSPPDKMVQLMNKLREKISVSEVKDTLLLKINVEDYDPEMAKNIANDLAEFYIEFNTSNRLKASRNTLEWMTAQLYETQKKMEDAEKAFLAYKQNEKIFSIQGKQNVITQKIQDFNDAYLDARNKRLELDSKIYALRKMAKKEGNLLHVRSLIDNPLIDNLYTQLLDAEVEYNRLSKVYKEKHPKIVQIQSKIEKTRIKLDGELEKEMESLKAQRSVLSSKERVLQNTISDFENDALETNKKELQYVILQRDVETNQKLYDTLFSKIKEANIEDNLDVSNIRIAEEAILPVSPVKPNKKRNLLLSAILGLMMGTGFAFLREYMDRSIHTEEDVQFHLDLPVLSVVPKAERP